MPIGISTNLIGAHVSRALHGRRPAPEWDGCWFARGRIRRSHPIRMSVSLGVRTCTLSARFSIGPAANSIRRNAGRAAPDSSSYSGTRPHRADPTTGAPHFRPYRRRQLTGFGRMYPWRVQCIWSRRKRLGGCPGRGRCRPGSFIVDSYLGANTIVSGGPIVVVVSCALLSSNAPTLQFEERRRRKEIMSTAGANELPASSAVMVQQLACD